MGDVGAMMAGESVGLAWGWLVLASCSVGSPMLWPV